MIEKVVLATVIDDPLMRREMSKTAERLETPSRQEAFRELVYRISTNFRRRRRTRATKDSVLSLDRLIVELTTPDLENKLEELTTPLILSPLLLRRNDMLLIIRKDGSKRAICSLRDITRLYSGTDKALD